MFIYCLMKKGTDYYGVYAIMYVKKQKRRNTHLYYIIFYIKTWGGRSAKNDKWFAIWGRR